MKRKTRLQNIKKHIARMCEGKPRFMHVLIKNYYTDDIQSNRQKQLETKVK